MLLRGDWSWKRWFRHGGAPIHTLRHSPWIISIAWSVLSVIGVPLKRLVVNHFASSKSLLASGTQTVRGAASVSSPGSVVALIPRSSLQTIQFSKHLKLGRNQGSGTEAS